MDVVFMVLEDVENGLGAGWERRMEDARLQDARPKRRGGDDRGWEFQLFSFSAFQLFRFYP
jgi:hypothetical protein